MEKLEEEPPLPCIIHWYQRHFVVVYKIHRDKVFVADPAAGLITYTKEEFKKGWLSAKENGREEGVALLLEPLPSFYEYEPEQRTKRKSLVCLFGYLKGNRKFIVAKQKFWSVFDS